ncbi:O-antigen ligase family protein [Oxalobacteraceae bacterium R-40]|uniref:O-antigen ligase family protein n=1 Tax=Keguizhuia sedimenti TaxID=3064264 RepID=A0ABU1BNU7_9BURK|nr:O-antigen ligase family protein [Oxalobacteraceae bacterium R-40]
MNATEVFSTLTIALLIVPLVLAVSLKEPKLVVYGFLVAILMFRYSTWGELQPTETIYARGVGIFHFSLVNLALFVAGIATLMRKLANPLNPHLAAPLAPYFFSFVFMMLAHIALGSIAGIDLERILEYEGLINIFNMFIFMYMVVLAFNSEKDKRDLLLVFLALAGIRSLFGLVRYFVFDGDTANPYRNLEGMDIKIFFFDIADNFVAAVAAFCAAWLLLSPSVRLSMTKRLFLYGYLALEIAAIALSFRRSSLIGLALTFGWLIFLLPSRKRIPLLILGAAVMASTIVVFFQERLQYAGATDIVSSLIYDITSNNTGDVDRFYELRAAAASLDGNWLFGLGSWGRFTGDQELLAFHMGKFMFVHSGFGHIILKSGIAGLLIFCGLLFSYIMFYLRHRKHLVGNSRLLADAGFAGFLFWTPTLLIGTPIIEFRTMLLIGLCLAMPYVAAGVSARKYYVSYPHYAAA